MKQSKFADLDLNLYAPISGQLQPLAQLSDPLFNRQMMGFGLAINPTSCQLFAPLTGEVVFWAGDSLLLQRADGLQVYLQIGIDTAILKGAPLVHLVTSSKRICAKAKLLNVDLEAISAAHLAPTVILTFPNLSKPLADSRMQYHQVKAGAQLCLVEFS